MAWKDPEFQKAVAFYLRLFMGFALACLLVWMFANERVDLDSVIRVLIGMLTIDRLGAAITTKRGE